MSNQPPIGVPQGAIRLNTESHKLEFYAQDRWHEMATHIHTLNGGGRGLIAGDNPTSNEIEYFTIPTAGNGIDFGDMTRNSFLGGSGSSRTRAVMMGGDAGPGGRVADIDFVNMLSTGNASDFGDLATNNGHACAVSNQTRAIICGGGNSSGALNIMEFITIATTGNSLDFGDTLAANQQMGGTNSPTRGLMFGGAPRNDGTIEFITISTKGNSHDFGELRHLGESLMGSCLSSPVRAIVGGGDHPDPQQGIEYVTIATK